MCEKFLSVLSLFASNPCWKLPISIKVPRYAVTHTVGVYCMADMLSSRVNEVDTEEQTGGTGGKWENSIRSKVLAIIREMSFESRLHIRWLLIAEKERRLRRVVTYTPRRVRTNSTHNRKAATEVNPQLNP